jgi:parvulin-like peptidyl-prolyl isomerase
MRIRLAILALLAWGPVLVQAERPHLFGIAAIVNESAITIEQIYQICEGELDLYNRTYYSKPEVLAEKRQALLNDAMQQLIDRQLILDDFKKSGLNLPDNYIDEEVKDQIRKRFGDRATFAKSIRAQGMTVEDYRNRARDEIILAAMTEKNVRSAIQISPKKIETYYVTNLTKYKVDDQVKLRMIVLSSPSAARSEASLGRALEIRQKLNDGAPFAEMASIYSDGSQRRDGGLWGWIEQTKLNKGLGSIAFSLPINQPSKVIGVAREANDDYWIIEYGEDGKPVLARKYTTVIARKSSGGKEEEVKEEKLIEEKTGAALAAPDALPMPAEYYVMMVEEKQIAHTKPLEEVRDEIEKELILQERSTLRKKWIERLKQKSFVRYF